MKILKRMIFFFRASKLVKEIVHKIDIINYNIYFYEINTIISSHSRFFNCLLV